MLFKRKQYIHPSRNSKVTVVHEKKLHEWSQSFFVFLIPLVLFLSVSAGVPLSGWLLVSPH